MLTNSNAILGKQGEQFVASWLAKDGFSILAQNYRKRYGEVDIIALRDEVLAFVEVKLRTHYYFNISEVITPSKQRKIIKVAQSFISEFNIQEKVIRFDVALVEYKNQFDLTYIPNAFTKQIKY